MKFLIAIDQGTTSSRTILFDEKLVEVARAQKEFPQIFPQPGWVLGLAPGARIVGGQSKASVRAAP